MEGDGSVIVDWAAHCGQWLANYWTFKDLVPRLLPDRQGIAKRRKSEIAKQTNSLPTFSPVLLSPAPSSPPLPCACLLFRVFALSPFRDLIAMPRNYRETVCLPRRPGFVRFILPTVRGMIRFGQHRVATSTMGGAAEGFALAATAGLAAPYCANDHRRTWQPPSGQSTRGPRLGGRVRAAPTANTILTSIRGAFQIGFWPGG